LCSHSHGESIARDSSSFDALVETLRLQLRNEAQLPSGVNS